MRGRNLSNNVNNKKIITMNTTEELYVIKHNRSGYFTGLVTDSLPGFSCPIFDRDIKSAEKMSIEMANKFLQMYKNHEECEIIKYE